MLGGIVVQFDVAFISLVESDTHLKSTAYDSVRVVLVVTELLSSSFNKAAGGLKLIAKQLS